MDEITRGLVLDVPYKDKDEAKALGARWDPDLRKWFVPQGEDTLPFAKWFPAERSMEQARG